MIGILWDSGRPLNSRSANYLTGSNRPLPTTQVAVAFDRSRASAPSSQQPSLPPSARRSVPQGTRFRGLARTGSATVFDGRQGEAAGYQQARQHLPARGADPRRTRCSHAHKARPLPDGASMNALEARAPRNVLVVAMANKLACVA